MNSSLWEEAGDQYLPLAVSRIYSLVGRNDANREDTLDWPSFGLQFDARISKKLSRKVHRVPIQPSSHTPYYTHDLCF